MLKLPSSEVWAIEIKHGNAPKVDKHYARICDDVGATQKFIVYGGSDAFSVGNDVTMIALPLLLKRLHAMCMEIK